MVEAPSDTESIVCSDNAPFPGRWLPLLNGTARRIALLRLLSVGGALLTGVLFAGVARIALTLSSRGHVAIGLYNRAMTLHAIVMVYLVLIPGIPFALGPWLHRASMNTEKRTRNRVGWASLCAYWCGAIVIVTSTLQGRFETGLCYMTAFHGSQKAAAIWLTLGVLAIAVASALNAYGFADIPWRRRAGDYPANGRSTLSTLITMSAVAQTLLLLVQVCTVMLMLAERFGAARIDTAASAEPTLFLHLFWFYAQPALLTSVLPVMGIIAHVFEPPLGQPACRNGWIVHAGLVFSILAFSSWGIHLVGAGQSPLMCMLFSATSLLLLVPLSAAFSVWLGQLRRSPLAGAPLMLAVGAMITLLLGVLSGLPVAVLSTSSILGRTFFELGQLHFIGSAVVLAALLLTLRSGT